MNFISGDPFCDLRKSDRSDRNRYIVVVVGAAEKLNVCIGEQKTDMIPEKTGCLFAADF